MFGTDRPGSKMRRTILWGGLLFFAVLLQCLARCIPGFAEGYAVLVYPVIMRVVGGISNLASFAVDEVLIYGIVLASFGYVAAGILFIWKKRTTIRSWLLATLENILKIGILWLLAFTVTCGINYHRTAFSVLAELPMEPSTVDELEGLCLWLTDRIEETAAQITVNEKGLCSFPEQMQKKTQEAMMQLGEKYPQLGGWYPRAKPVFTSRVLSMEFLEGIFGPYTMEANYNPDIPAYNQPAVLCHELSHLKGFMREDEANYIAYLACTDSEDANIRYSGLLLAYTHSINALHRADYERFGQVRGLLCDQAERDYAYHRVYWAQYQGPVAEISDKVNDAYLKANAQNEGVASYGRMVDLLLGEYRQRMEG